MTDGPRFKINDPVIYRGEKAVVISAYTRTSGYHLNGWMYDINVTGVCNVYIVRESDLEPWDEPNHTPRISGDVDTAYILDGLTYTDLRILDTAICGVLDEIAGGQYYHRPGDEDRARAILGEILRIRRGD